MRRFFPVFLLICVTITPVYIQAQDEGWQVVERCVAPATEPPEDWQFDGTILLTGWAGLHGVRADSNTPAILVFSEANWLPSSRLDEGSKSLLSPDGRWLAVPKGEFDTPNCPPCWDQVWDVESIAVYSTIERGLVYRIDNPVHYEDTQYPPPGHLKLRWFDNEHVIYAKPGEYLEDAIPDAELINPFTGVGTAIMWSVSPLIDENFMAPAPDWSRLVYNLYPSLSSTRQDYIINVENGERSAKLPLWDTRTVTWRHDSQHFLAVTDRGLTFFDRDGQIIELIYPSGRYENLGWSYDGRYFSFIAMDSDERGTPSVLFIGETSTGKIYNTCLSVENYHWSSNASQLALMHYNTRNKALRDPTLSRVDVFDLALWQQYTAAYHNGLIIGWRADD